MQPIDDEFYVGYGPKLPPAIGRRVRRAVAMGMFVALTIAAIVTRVQHPLADASFDYGRTQSWSGYLTRTPAPAILVPVANGFRRHWLVARGKHGASAAIADVPDGWVRAKGIAIARDPWHMIEIATIAAASAPPATRPPALDTGAGSRVSIRGEIVDSKCYLGVMNPGERIVHRDCAVRCLSGGVTPMVAFRAADGSSRLAVVVDENGVIPPERVRGRIGRVVSLTGHLFTVGDALVLRLDSQPGGSS